MQFQFKEKLYIDYSNDEGTLLVAHSNVLCSQNVSKIPSIQKAIQLQKDDNKDTYSTIYTLGEYAIYYIKLENDEELMLFFHYSYDLNSPSRYKSLLEYYNKELSGAQDFAKKNYTGEKFGSIHFVFVPPGVANNQFQ